jgi:predicted ABC-type transport system involved in lysophospholipase L1 biosynthesis ATPase subunit
VNITIPELALVVLVGPSGCGKSTLLNIVGLIDAPSRGDYYFGDTEVSGYSENRLADLRKGNVGLIFQSLNCCRSWPVAPAAAKAATPAASTKRTTWCDDCRAPEGSGCRLIACAHVHCCNG